MVWRLHANLIMEENFKQASVREKCQKPYNLEARSQNEGMKEIRK